jgi:putative DNA primase/helicase
MTKRSPPRAALRKSPHITAENFRASQRPTLINYEEEFLAYDGEGAYRLIKDRTINSEVQTYLEGALEGDRPFFPKTADVLQVSQALERKNHVPSGAISPPFFLPGDLDWSNLDPRNVIACRNGLLTIDTRTLYPATPQFFTRSALPIAYDADARPERWLTFLFEVLGDEPELILLMQQMFGYLITSDTSHQKIFYFRGISNSGKSTTMRVLDALIGARNICNPSIADLAERSTLNDMAGSTLAKITDMNTDDRQKLSEACSVMNRISGEDPVHVFRKFKEGLDVILRLRFLMAGNQFLNFGEHATALARRLLVIPFNVSFEENADPGLSAKLIAELPAILNWSLDGLDALRAAGRFIEPEASKLAKRDIMNSGDPIRSFLADECEIGPEFSARKDDLFARYKQHCGVIGVRLPLSYPKFFASLKTAVNGLAAARPRTDDGGREHTMVGIGLTDVERVPTITFKLDPMMLDLGFDRTDPLCLLSDRDGRPVVADEFAED